MRMRNRFGPLLLVWLMIALVALIGCQPKNPVIPAPGTPGGGPATSVAAGTGTINGVVLEFAADGVTRNRVTGAKVVVIDARNNVFGANGEVLTDTNGSFIVNGVAIGQAKISANKGSFATDPNRLQVVNVRPGETTNIEPLLLISGVITGKVLILNADGTRSVQGGAQVTALPSTAPTGGTSTATTATTDLGQLVTTTKDDGTFSFTNVKPGTYTLTATFVNTANQNLISNPSIVSVTQGVALAPTLLLQANITTTRVVFGKVVDINNNPLSGATVRDKLTSISTTTDSSGIFQLSLTIGPKDPNPRSVSIQKAGAKFSQDKALDINAGIPGQPASFPSLTFLDNVLNFTGTVVNRLNSDLPVKASATITVVGNSTISGNSSPVDGTFVLSGIPQQDNLLIQADGVTGFLRGTAQFFSANFIRTNTPSGYKCSPNADCTPTSVVVSGVTVSRVTVTDPTGLSYNIDDGTTINSFRVTMRPVGSVQVSVKFTDNIFPNSFPCVGPYGTTLVQADDNRAVLLGSTPVRIVLTDPADGTTKPASLSLPATPTEDVKCIPQGAQQQQPVVIGTRHLGNIIITTVIDDVPGGTQILSVTALGSINRTGIEVKVPAGNVIVAPLITLGSIPAAEQLGDVTGTVFFVDNFGNLDQTKKLSWVTLDLLNPQAINEGAFAEPNPYGRQPVTILPIPVAPFATQSSPPTYVCTFATDQGGKCGTASPEPSPPGTNATHSHLPLSEKTGVNNTTGQDIWIDLNNNGIENDVAYPSPVPSGTTVQNINSTVPITTSGHGYMLLSTDFNGNGVNDEVFVDTHNGDRSISDISGNFTLHGVPETSTFISAFKPGFLPKKVSLLNVVGGAVNVAPVFGITPIAGSVSGQVFVGTDITSPLSGITVSADPTIATPAGENSCGGGNGICTTTDSQGFYVFTNLTAGAHTISATVSGVTKTCTAAATDSTTFVCPTVARSTGQHGKDFHF